jgi:hypothetical protein
MSVKISILSMWTKAHPFVSSLSKATLPNVAEGRCDPVRVNELINVERSGVINGVFIFDLAFN